MNKKGEFDENEVESLLKETNYEEKTKQRYKKLFEANEKIRTLVKNDKMCKESIQTVLGIFCQIKVIEFIYTMLPKKDRKNFRINREGFNSDTDFFAFIFMNNALEIEERNVKIKLAYIIDNFLKELKKIEKQNKK